MAMRAVVCIVVETECNLTKEKMMLEQEKVPFGWVKNLGDWSKSNLQKYSLNLQEWGKLYDRQNGRCGGCGEVLADPRVKTTEMGLKPQVDHRHSANEPQFGTRCQLSAVRGLLCGRCNRLLGVIQDNKNLLQNLVNYLKQHGDY